jgi:hypothetical protein
MYLHVIAGAKMEVKEENVGGALTMLLDGVILERDLLVAEAIRYVSAYWVAA